MEKRLIAMANKLQSRHYSKILNLTKTSPEEWKILLQRKALLLKGNMQRERVVLINLPRFTSSSMPLRIRYSYSNLAGHGSFVLLAISYMESDFLSLRLCALSAISLSIAFQYYREKPLWIPIRWNFLFLLINGIMVGKLLSDESTAERIPTQQKSLYASVFKNKGMNLVDYHNLMSIAKIEEYKKGDELISYGTYNNKLHFVVSGKLNATRGNVFLGTIHDNQFVGEVGFLRMKEYYAQQDPSKPQSAIDHLKSDAKWIAKYLNKLVGNCNNFTVGMNKNKLGGDVGNGELKTIDHPVSKTSVMCDEDCEVYTWDFHELHELLRRNPAMDRVFELCMSSDLHKKLDTGVQLEPRLRYRQVLKGFLLSDEISSSKKESLTAIRQEYKISETDHYRMLTEFGWTKQDFDSGFKGGPDNEIIATYKKKLELALDSPKVSSGVKRSLRSFRQQYGIKHEVHLQLLRSFGWSPDEYEDGLKLHSNLSSSILSNLMGRASDLFNGHNRTPVLILSGGSQSERSPKSSKEDSAASIQRKKEDETELEMTEEKALTECKDFDNSDDSTWSIGSRYIARYAGWLLGYDQGQLMNTSHSLPSYQATSHIDRSTKT